MSKNCSISLLYILKINLFGTFLVSHPRKLMLWCTTRWAQWRKPKRSLQYLMHLLQFALPSSYCSVYFLLTSVCTTYVLQCVLPTYLSVYFLRFAVCSMLNCIALYWNMCRTINCSTVKLKLKTINCSVVKWDTVKSTSLQSVQ